MSQARRRWPWCWPGHVCFRPRPVSPDLESAWHRGPPAGAGRGRGLAGARSSTSTASGCHNARLKTADLLLDQLDLAHLGDHPDIGEKVVRKLRAGMMPPAGLPRPDPATLEALITLDGKRARPRRASPICRRPASTASTAPSTRTRFAICSGSKSTPRKFLPSDDSTHGFDNIAGALTMSPALMEAYLSAAGKISRLAIGDRIGADAGRVRRAGRHRAELPRRRAAVRHPRRHADRARVPGRRRVHASRSKGVDRLHPGGARRQIKGEQLEVTIDGERVKLFDWDKEIAEHRRQRRADAAAFR